MSARGTSYGEFLRGLINDPKAVSAPTPSSPTLSRIIAAEVDISRPGVVLELGPGTGVITRALLNRGIARDRIIAVECEPSFVGTMRQTFPGLVVHSGDALEFEKFIPSSAPIAAVVSGIPLLNIPPANRRSLIARALSTGGNKRFIQLSYGWLPPVPADNGFAISHKTVWRNFPPAHVWTYNSV